MNAKDRDALLTAAVELEFRAREDGRLYPHDGDGPGYLRMLAAKLRKIAGE